MKKLIVLISFCLLSSVGFAEEKLYLGASYNYILSNEGGNDNGTAAVIKENDDGNSDGWRIYGGYNINKNWAIEGSYWDLGKIESNDSDNLVAASGSDSSSDTNLFSVHAVRSFQLQNGFEKFTPFLKAGVAYVDSGSESGSDNDVGTGSESGEGGKDYAAGLGAGVKYAINEEIDLRGEYDRFFDVAGNDQNIFSVGLQYNF